MRSQQSPTALSFGCWRPLSPYRRGSGARCPSCWNSWRTRCMSGRRPPGPPWPADSARPDSGLPAARAGSLLAFGSAAATVAILFGGALGWFAAAALAGFGAAFTDLGERTRRLRFRDAVERDAPGLLDLV